MKLSEDCKATGSIYTVPRNTTNLEAYLHCLYISAHSTKNRQDKALINFHKYDITDISETWWNKPCLWGAEMDDYQVFRKDT